MNFTINMGNSPRVGNGNIFGRTENGESFNFDLNNATLEQQNTCSNFLNVVGKHAGINIINSSYHFLDVNYVISEGVDTDLVEVDYSALSNSDKTKIDDFATLLNSLTN